MKSGVVILCCFSLLSCCADRHYHKRTKHHNVTKSKSEVALRGSMLQAIKKPAKREHNIEFDPN